MRKLSSVVAVIAIASTGCISTPAQDDPTAAEQAIVAAAVPTPTPAPMTELEQLLAQNEQLFPPENAPPAPDPVDTTELGSEAQRAAAERVLAEDAHTALVKGVADDLASREKTLADTGFATVEEYVAFLQYRGPRIGKRTTGGRILTDKAIRAMYVVHLAEQAAAKAKAAAAAGTPAPAPAGTP